MSPVEPDNPLAHVEARVQQRAKDRALDLADDESQRLLASFIDEEIQAWNDDHRRGLRSHPLSEPSLVAERALRNLTGYGPLGPLLGDDDVWEIMINAPTAIFVKRHAGRSGYHHEVFHDDEHVTRTLTKILDDSTQAHRKLDSSEGLQDAQLDDGARLHIVHADVARGGHMVINIRKFTGVAIRSLDELVDRRMLTNDAAQFLRACVEARQTIVFAGAPGAGKTTMLSCCAAELDPSLRVVVAEEVFEADIPLANVTEPVCRPQCADLTPTRGIRTGHIYPGRVNAVDRHRGTRPRRTPSGTRRIECAERFGVRANTRQTATCGNCSIEHGVSHLRRRTT